ncbi:MAG: hypothetical protein R3F55_23130 [Alphaproteobacteria bacterium]
MGGVFVEGIDDVIRRIREERGAEMLDVYRVCESHDVLVGALNAICDGHGDPAGLARATLQFVNGTHADPLRAKA